MTGNLTQKFTLIATLLTTLTTVSMAEQEEVDAQQKEWYTDIEVAKKVAQEKKKNLLIQFTRAKGCGWCLKLEKEVLIQPEFQKQIPKHYVMVILNYPHDDSEWTSETKEKHEKLKKYYRVRKFPYLVFADANGRPYEGENYRDRKPKEYLEELDGIRRQREKRDALFTAAKNAKGKEKARFLERGLSEVSRKYHRYYQDVIDQIAEADPDDISGFVAKARVDQVRLHLERILKPPHSEERDHSSAPAAVDDYIREHKPTGEALQVAMLYKLQSLYLTKQYLKAKTVADEIIGVNDASRASHYASSMKKRIEHIYAEAKEAEE